MIVKNHVELLLVEDNPQDLELMRRCLEKIHLSNQIHVARDGAEALEYLFCVAADGGLKNVNHLKLVVLDLKMPKIDGSEVLNRIKNDPRTRRIPVVIMTSSQEPQDITRSYDLGANSFVVKPVAFKPFCEAVQSVGHYWLRCNHEPTPAVLP